MDQKIVIRDARDADYPVLAAMLHALAHRFIVPDMTPDIAQKFLAENDAAAMRVNRGQGHVISVAEVDGIIAGFIAVCPPHHLFHLFVAEAFHRQGVARRLWDGARGAAGQFTVNSSPYAVPVYLALGFERAGPMACKHGVTFQPMRYDAAG
jgi:GNAT superfamily N-acetyltransferase